MKIVSHNVGLTSIHKEIKITINYRIGKSTITSNNSLKQITVLGGGRRKATF